MNRSHLISAVLALLLVGLGVWWWHTFERKEVTRRLPLSGEARINPLYGLQTLLRERSLEVQTQAQFRPEALPAQPGLVVLSADLRGLSWPATQALLDWVEAGGQLLVALPAPDGGSAPLLEHFDFWTQTSPACIHWKYSAPPAAQKAAKRAIGGAPQLPTLEELLDPLRQLQSADRWCASHRLHFGDDLGEQDFDWLYGNATDGWLFARLRHGGGQITFSSQLDFLGTRALRSPAHPALAWQLLAPALAAEPAVLLVYAADLPPLHVLIVRHGWPILLPLLLALLAWMWMRSQRFGPLQPEVATPRRALREHLRAAAELALRRRQGSALLKPLRQRVLQRLALAQPEIAALPAHELAQALAARHSLSPIAVEQALFDIRIERPAALAEAVRTLHRLSLRP